MTKGRRFSVKRKISLKGFGLSALHRSVHFPKAATLKDLGRKRRVRRMKA